MSYELIALAVPRCLFLYTYFIFGISMLTTLGLSHLEKTPNSLLVFPFIGKGHPVGRCHLNVENRRQFHCSAIIWRDNEQYHNLRLSNFSIRQSLMLLYSIQYWTATRIDIPSTVSWLPRSSTPYFYLELVLSGGGKSST